MRGWLYLIRNRDLYKIGITKNFENRMRQLKPDNIIARLYTKDYYKLEKELHNRYKKLRIPQTEYFRLEDHHIKEIKQRIHQHNFRINILLGIFIKSLLLTSSIFFLIFIVLFLNLNDINIIIFRSLVWMERISLTYAFITLFVKSGNYLGCLGELKYRLSNCIIYIIFAFFFKIAPVFLL